MIESNRTIKKKKDDFFNCHSQNAKNRARLEVKEQEIERTSLMHHPSRKKDLNSLLQLSNPIFFPLQSNVHSLQRGSQLLKPVIYP